MKRQLFALAFCLAFLPSLIICAQAATTYNLGAFGEMTKTVQLYEGDSISGTLEVSDGYGTFVIQDPDKTPVYTYGLTSMSGGTITFSYSADRAGSYYIIYWNLAFQSVRATLDYSVKSSGIGFIQANMWLIVLVFLGVVGLGVILFWRSNARKQYGVRNLPQSGMVPKSEIKCGSCGTLNTLDTIYCKQCGNKLQ
jgi:hypothetical protein